MRVVLNDKSQGRRLIRWGTVQKEPLQVKIEPFGEHKIVPVSDFRAVFDSFELARPPPVLAQAEY